MPGPLASGTLLIKCPVKEKTEEKVKDVMAMSILSSGRACTL